MSESLNSYLHMAKRINEPLEKLKTIENPPSSLLDLLVTGSAISTMATSMPTEPLQSVNLATLYDSVSTLRTLSESILLSSKRSEVQEIAEESKKAASEIKSKLDFKQTNDHLFEYYREVVDISTVSNVVEMICTQLDAGIDSKSLWLSIKALVGHVKARINIMVKKLETIIGSVGKKLASSIKELEETIGKKIVEFAARLKSFVENVHEFALSLIRRMFGFVEDIQKIAKENNWNMKQIVIEMPSCDVKVLLIAGFPIPIPKISVPKLAVTFAPL